MLTSSILYFHSAQCCRFSPMTFSFPLSKCMLGMQGVLATTLIWTACVAGKTHWRAVGIVALMGLKLWWNRRTQAGIYLYRFLYTHTASCQHCLSWLPFNSFPTWCMSKTEHRYKNVLYHIMVLIPHLLSSRQVSLGKWYLATVAPFLLALWAELSI